MNFELENIVCEYGNKICELGILFVKCELGNIICELYVRKYNC